MARVPGTYKPKAKEKLMSEVEQEQVEQFVIPLEIVVHQGATTAQKIPTPEGVVTLFRIVSPTGIAISMRLDDAACENIREQLRTSDILVPNPGGIVLP